MAFPWFPATQGPVPFATVSRTVRDHAAEGLFRHASELMTQDLSRLDHARDVLVATDRDGPDTLAAVQASTAGHQIWDELAHQWSSAGPSAAVRDLTLLQLPRLQPTRIEAARLHGVAAAVSAQPPVPAIEATPSHDADAGEIERGPADAFDATEPASAPPRHGPHTGTSGEQGGFAPGLGWPTAGTHHRRRSCRSRGWSWKGGSRHSTGARACCGSAQCRAECAGCRREPATNARASQWPALAIGAS